MIYVLYYQDCDDLPVFVKYSDDIDKLCKESERLNKLYEDELARYDIIQAKYYQSFQEFIKENKEFWLRNQHALKNPNRTDGLWVYDILIKKAKYSFRPSGWWPDESDFKDLYETKYHSEEDIKRIREEEICARLCKQTDYSKLTYIDWLAVKEPLPVFVPDENYVNFKFQYTYHQYNIQDVEELL